MTDFNILAPAVQAILRSTASQVLAFDPDLARDLADLAADYAGPYTEETE
jgi:hypothetical protein